MPTTWKNKMIEQGFNYTGATVKEILCDYSRKLEAQGGTKIHLQLPRNLTRKALRNANGKTPTPVS